ncbi:MAG: M14 family zinc carboxypeptidase [Bacteroides sp.]|nr:M14 family zinc carboxypeptidase [Bacteroides sp.]
MNRCRTILIPFLAVTLFAACKAERQTPAQHRNFTSPTTHAELGEFLEQSTEACDLLKLEVFGQSAGGLDLFVVKAGKDEPSPSGEKLRVLVLAQQHGNEHSGKEAALLLIDGMLCGRHKRWFDTMEIWIIPQMNPDGSEVNERRNSEGIDFNRDHVVMQSAEVRALHDLSHDFMPHVTLDIHEYHPYSDAWEAFGAFKQFDVQTGIITNPNLSQDIRKYSEEVVLPGLENKLKAGGYTFHNYLVGPAPPEGPTRHSTVDIDDGRQSFGVLGSMSFIFEGLNGRDRYADSLQRRAQSQAMAVRSLMDIIRHDREKIIQMVDDSRRVLVSGGNDTVAIRMDHFPGEKPLQLLLKSSQTGKDTLVKIHNYHPLVKPTFSIERARGYLIPRSDSLLMALISNHHIEYQETFEDPQQVFAYRFAALSRSFDEGLKNYFPEVEKEVLDAENYQRDYIFVPVTQLHSHFLALTLEPQSQIGLIQYPLFQYLLRENEHFPVLRVE